MLKSRLDDPSRLKTLKYQLVKQNISFFHTYGLDLFSYNLFWSFCLIIFRLNASCSKFAILSGRSYVLFVCFVGTAAAEMSQFFASKASPLLLELCLFFCG